MSALSGSIVESSFYTLHSLSSDKHSANFYLNNTSQNRNGWAVAEKSLREALPTLKKASLGIRPDYKFDQHTDTADGTHGPIFASTTALGIVFGEGPTMAAQYRDEAKGFDGYIIRKWQEPKVVIHDAITIICI